MNENTADQLIEGIQSMLVQMNKIQLDPKESEETKGLAYHVRETLENLLWDSGVTNLPDSDDSN